ncbi:hypothetical protein [Campylobacter pinnipediorum]|uniref:hypothetical protein n=1 Tax=Campylobacter pinnipediorum TaxID=1965231 RepID=UPI00084DE253|nr:hypothetical protein [Campylobacter pinnipediorum]AQW80789.1 hypothetical protein CPIN17260_0461 [Campylobacter pinnipediorum subsp. pinnipediorum]AQW83325.1 hypothetical protein CPIN17261_1327 [Campylobacter pinnipediorum subsp. pinnipediorum]OPA75431.1 hypothetical protein BFG05_06040 [Campylobacter pinnipediorum subsp. pinnipediorum]
MNKLMLICFLLVLILSGCANDVKNIEPRYIYKDVYVPIKCQASMPQKPKNDRSFESHKQIMLYLLECERLLKECLGVSK